MQASDNGNAGHGTRGTAAARSAAFVFTYRGALIPLAFVVPLLAAPLSSGSTGLACGLAGVAVGFALRILGVRRIGGRARVHSAGARVLVTSGVFSRLRHPLYLGNTLVAAGLTALYLSAAAGALVFAFVLALYSCVARHEERSLLLQAGEPYRRYLRHVPRWLPRLRPVAPNAAPAPAVPWRKVMCEERVFAAGVAGLVLLAFGWRAARAHLMTASPPGALRLVLAAAAVAASLSLLVKVAARLQRKRGSWLAVERLSGGPAERAAEVDCG